MIFHSLFVNFQKAAKLEIVVCCKLLVAFYGLTERKAQFEHKIEILRLNFLFLIIYQ